MIALMARIGLRLFADVRIEGVEHVPKTGAVILAANHLSNADSVPIAGFITPALRRRRIHWMGKREMFEWPLLGEIFPRFGVHPVERGTADIEAYRLATRILEAGYVLIIFPEGTRSPDGALQEAKDGLATLALRTGAVIVPIGISNTDALWPRGRLPLPIPRHTITMRVGTPFSVADLVPAGTDRRAAKAIATTAIMGRIAALLDPRHRGVYADAVPPGGRRPRLIRPAAHRTPAAETPRVCDHRPRMGTVEDVRIAKRTGFCYGVREAIDKAKESAAAGKATHTLGQVVHNEGVIRDLQQIGVESVESLDDVDHGAAVVIRAHGVKPEIFERAEARGLEVIDGTCTWVIQEQRQLEELVAEGYTVVLLGTPKHPEVAGLLGFAPDAIVVDEEEDWDRIPRRKRMALITQSTQPPWKFEKLAAFMVSRAHELKIVNSVCPVTIRRQEDTLETARDVDLMVVVGGRHSANTKELTRLCQIVGTEAIQIENARDLDDPAPFADARVVGVTGGTSTPIEDLRDVAERIFVIAGTDDARGRAPQLAREALDAAAHPAGRTTSLPTKAAAPVGAE